MCGAPPAMLASAVQPWRHRRVWLSPSLKTSDVQGPGDSAATQALLDWAAQGRPVVARGALPGDPPDRLPIGLALVRGEGRVRLAFTVPAPCMLRIEPPLLLTEAMPMLPSAMREAAQALTDQATALDLPVHVYGSVFWQHASGDPYLHATSDIDLLVQPRSARQVRVWLALLAQFETSSAVRLDGEVELPSGRGVAWRELAGTADKVLLKSDRGPSLVSRADVWAEWSEVS